MKIMSNLKYEAMLDLVTGQKKIIAEKEAEIKRLKEQVKRLDYLLEVSLTPARRSNEPIDFPNSERKEGYESSNIFDL